MLNNKKYNLPKEWALKYSKAKAAAKYRNQYWAFTPETWFDMWVESGVMVHRDRQQHGYCMIRRDPIEAWSPNNCMIIPRRLYFQITGYLLENPGAEWPTVNLRHNVIDYGDQDEIE